MSCKITNCHDIAFAARLRQISGKPWDDDGETPELGTGPGMTW